MNIDKALEKMDSDALVNVMAKANALLFAKNKEPTHVVWLVRSDNWCDLGWFKSDEYIKAAEFLLAEAKEAVQDTDHQKSMRLSLDYIQVPESELKDWFSE